MRLISYLIISLFSLALFNSLSAQTDSIFDQGVYRTYIVHLPPSYTPSKSYPLVLNIHGLYSSAAGQESYSKFDDVADTLNFIVVYPNAQNNAWDFNGPDAIFLVNLIDSLKKDFSISCLFSTGISMGGHMTYELVCALSNQLTAIAVIAANMPDDMRNLCTIPGGVPLMHFHGTKDPIAKYTATPKIPSVDSLISWWVDKNKCNPVAVKTSIPDINPGDSCTVEKYFYGNGINGSQVIFYKIINGGHTWPGAAPVALLGKTNKDINASALIGAFFRSFCPVSTAVTQTENNYVVQIFPNPSPGKITISLPDNFVTTEASLRVYNNLGQIFYAETIKHVNGDYAIDISNLAPGIYFLQLKNTAASYFQKIIISR